MPGSPAPLAKQDRALSPLAVLCLLAGIIAVQIAASATWMYRNGFFSPDRPPFHDCAYFRQDAYDIQKRIEQQGVKGLIKGGLAHDRPHPPIPGMLNAISGYFHGRIDVYTQWTVNALYVAGLVIALYLLGRVVLGTPGRGLAFSFFGSFLPVYVASARVALPKFPMMVMVFFALHALLRTAAFTNRRWSLAFGFWTGVAVMTMMLAPIYIAGSALTAFVIGLRRGPRRAVIVNVLLATVVAAAIVATWYPQHWRRVLDYASLVTSAEGQKFWSGGVKMWSIERWMYYPAQLINQGLGFFLAAAVAIVLIAGALALLVRRRTPQPAAAGSAPRSYGLILTVGALVAFVIVARGQVAAESQYIMNLPALTLLFAWLTAFSLPWRWLRGAALALLCAGTIVSAALTFRPVDQDVMPAPHEKWRIPIEGNTQINIVGQMDTYGGGPARAQGVYARPEAEKWPIEDVVQLMEANRTFPEIRLAQVMGVATPYMTPGNLEYVAWLHGFRTRVVSTPGFPPFNPDDMKNFAIETEFMVADPIWSANVKMAGDAEKSAVAGVEAAGARLTKIFERPVTPMSTVVLYQITHPDRAVELVDAVPPDAIHETAEYFNGWRLRGFQHRAGSEANSILLVTYWEAPAAGAGGYEILVRAQAPGSTADDWRSSDSTRDLRKPGTPDTAGKILAITSGPVPLSPGGRLLLIMSRSGVRESKIKASTLQAFGPHTLLVLRRGQDGSITTGRKS